MKKYTFYKSFFFIFFLFNKYMNGLHDKRTQIKFAFENLPLGSKFY